MPIYKRKYRKRKAKAKTSTDKRQDALLGRLMSGIENKHNDKSVASAATTASTVNPLSLMGEGTGSGQRAGLKITGHKLKLRWYVQWAADVIYNNRGVRFIVVRDKNPDGAYPLVTDILESAHENSLYNNINEGKRFVVLYDTMCQPNVNSATAGAGNFRYYSHEINLRNTNIYFLDGNNTAASCGRNQIFAFWITNTNNANSPDVSLNSRLYYTDL